MEAGCAMLAVVGLRKYKGDMYFVLLQKGGG